MRQWFEFLMTFMLLTLAVAAGTILAHFIMYITTFLFYLFLGI